MDRRDSNFIFLQGRGISIRVAISDGCFTSKPVVNIAPGIIPTFKVLLKSSSPLPRHTHARYPFRRYSGYIDIEGRTSPQTTLGQKPNNLLAELRCKTKVGIFPGIK